MALSREKISAAFLFLILAVMIGAVIYVALSLRTDPVKETLENDEVIKVLVVINDGQGNCLSTDLLAYYPPFRKGVLFDIPGNIGDIFKSIDRTDRIDAIYREKGIPSFVTEVSRLTDTIIPFTVELSLDNLSTLTDMLGGLNLFISAPVDSLSPAGERWLLPSGQINLDGDKIKTYMTYLLEGEGESELDDRRQSVIVSLLSAINENRKQMFSKKNFKKYVSLFDSNVDSDSFYKLVELIANINTDGLAPFYPQGNFRVTTSGQRLWFLQDSGQLIKDVIKTTISSLASEDTKEGNRVYVVEVLNGTDVSGSARNAAYLLQGMGYEIFNFGNTSSSDYYEHTLIISHIGDSAPVRTFADFITCKNIEIEAVDPFSGDDGTGMDVDFTLILGKDWDGRYVRGGYTGAKEEEALEN